MENYRKSAHCTYDIKYHLVWITKYRKPVITGKIALRTRELIRIICQSNEVEILAGHVGNDHIHLLVSVPPHLSASKLVQYIKGNTSRKLQMEYKELNKQFWVSDSELRETQTANYFSNLYPIDCAVLSVNAQSYRKYGTLPEHEFLPEI